MRTILFVSLTFLSFSSLCQIYSVPGQFSTIQSALDSLSSGDTIIVDPGVYFENVNFRGKSIFLSSTYLFSNDTADILNTVVDGSQPIQSDTGSCVLFISGEDSAAVINGFTIRRGIGTKWTDIHGAGIYREGGGILIELSSPTISNNVIIDNKVTNVSGVVSTGGGGIRVGDGNPTIINNYIGGNEARYGGGIVLNYAGCKMYNNIIVNNSGGSDFNGGSAIWMVFNLGNTPKRIINNTIMYNSASFFGGTGGILAWSADNVIIKNNIIRNNSPALQIQRISAFPTINYNNVEGGSTGTNNIDLSDIFQANLILDSMSASVDQGDSSTVYNDNEDTSSTGNALFPSRGSIRNDIGAYGGPYAKVLPFIDFPIIPAFSMMDKVEVNIYPNPFSDFVRIHVDMLSIGSNYQLLSLEGKILKKGRLKEELSTIALKDLITGTYILKIQQNESVLCRKIIKN